VLPVHTNSFQSHRCDEGFLTSEGQSEEFRDAIKNDEAELGKNQCLLGLPEPLDEGSMN
jgi:hypothetical protein